MLRLSIQRLRMGLAIGWTLAIVVGCSIPGHTIPEFILFSQDKLIHLLIFAGFAVLWVRVYPHAAWAILAWGILFGIATELYQHWMPIGRSFDPLDALADTVGLLIGLGVMRPGRRPAEVSGNGDD